MPTVSPMSTTTRSVPISTGSHVSFEARYVGMRLAGRFERVEGEVHYDPASPEASVMEAVIHADSLVPAMSALGPVLRSSAALDVEAHPRIRFESRRVERVDGRTGPAQVGDRFSIEGELTVKGERHAVTLEATLETLDPEGGLRIVAGTRLRGLVADEELEVRVDLRAGAAGAAERDQEGADARRPPQVAGPPRRDEAGGQDESGGQDEVRGQVRIVGLSGSLRRGSLNRRLLEAAIALAPKDLRIDPFGLHRVPLYDGDVEAAGDPPAVARLKQAIRKADGLLIATPEYNHSIPAVTKNAIDWASRPPFDAPLAGKPVALMGASPGRSGARRGLEHARIALEAAGGLVLPDQVSVGRATSVFDADGSLRDGATRDAIVALLEALVAAAFERSARRAA